MTSQRKGIVGATFAGVKGRLAGQGPAPDRDLQLGGASCLVTGANSGLGKAIATQLAGLGGAVVMAGRTIDERARQEIIAASGNGAVALEKLDLASFASVLAFAERVQQAGQRFAVVVLNAAVVTARGNTTADGLDEMHQVNFLANLLLVEQLLARGCIAETRPGRAPRIVAVSSEAHRWVDAVELTTLGQPVAFGMRQAMTRYAETKFLMAGYVAHLARRQSADGAPPIAVHALCPGAVNTNIARQAPALLQPVLRAVFSLSFASPEKAARPVIQLACAPSLEGRRHVYYHLMAEKEIDPRAADPAFGEALFARAAEVIRATCGAVVG